MVRQKKKAEAAAAKKNRLKESRAGLTLSVARVRKLFRNKLKKQTTIRRGVDVQLTAIAEGILINMLRDSSAYMESDKRYKTVRPIHLRRALEDNTKDCYNWVPKEIGGTFA